MSTPVDTDRLLVSRGGTSYYELKENMAEIEDTDLLLISRAGTSYKITGADYKASLKKPPIISTVTLTEDDTGGPRFTNQSFTTDITCTPNSTAPLVYKVKAETYGTLYKQVETNELTDSDITTDPWVSRSAIERPWIGVAYGGGRYVAFSNGGQPRGMTSTDGINWSNSSVPGASYWNTVIYGGGKFVACAEAGQPTRICWSTNGTSWTVATPSAMIGWNGLAYGAGKFVCTAGGGSSDKIMYSSNANGWTGISGLPDPAAGYSSICFGNGKFIALTYAQYEPIWSTDGVNWNSSGNNALDGSWSSVVWGGDKYVAVSHDNAKPVNAMYSYDGINWVASTTVENNNWYGLAYGNGKFVAISYNGNIRSMYSFDGITWHASDPPLASWGGICFGDNKFLAVSWTPGTEVMESVNGGVATGTITLSGVKDLELLTEGDPVTQDNANGTFESYASNIVTLSASSGTWATGEIVEGPLVEVDNTTMYCLIDAQGDVSGLDTSDPGYQELVSSNAQQESPTFTFPSLLLDGLTPDETLLPGTSLCVDVKVENELGTDIMLSAESGACKTPA